MEKDLILSVKNAVQALYGAEIGDAQVTLQKTKKEFVGDWTLVCFPLLKISRKNPAVTAEEIGAYLKNKKSVIINLENVGKEDARRILDFLSGATFMIEGTIQKVSNLIYLMAPKNVEIQNDVERSQYKQKASFSWLK